MDIEPFTSLPLFPAASVGLKDLTQRQLLHLLQFLPGVGPAAYWRLAAALTNLQQLADLPSMQIEKILPPQAAAA